MLEEFQRRYVVYAAENGHSLFLTRLALVSLILALFLVACGSPTAPAPTPTAPPTSTTAAATPGVDPFFQNSGGGEPRTAGYWLLWNSCAPDNKSAQAAANGGRQAGWIILDDMLADPGLLLGKLQVETCQQALNLLKYQDLDGQEKADDPAYQLAEGLLTAQLNLAAGAAYCPAVDEAVRAGQLILLSLEFNGRGEYAEGLEVQGQDETVAFLIEQLRNYNQGALCR